MNKSLNNVSRFYNFKNIPPTKNYDKLVLNTNTPHRLLGSQNKPFNGLCIIKIQKNSYQLTTIYYT